MKSKLLCLVLLILLAACSTKVQKEEREFVKEVYPGVIHKQIIDQRDTLFINILKIDLRREDYHLQAIKASDSLLGRETVSAMVERLNDSGKEVIAAINSDFFIITEGGEPENNLVINSQFVKGTPETDSEYDTFDNIHYQFAVTETGKLIIDRFKFTGNLILNDDSVFRINRINSRTDSSSITFYNFYQGTKTPKADNGEEIYELSLTPLFEKSDTNFYIISKQLNSRGGNEIESGSVILSANYETADSLEKNISPGDTVKALFGLSPSDEQVITATGGWGKIVEAGKNVAGRVDSVEGTFPKFSAAKHPRTGIGISKDGNHVYFITVDGRQAISGGATLKEFAELMIDEGVFEGLNFDGGGSTTMVVDGNIVNSPSDKTGERSVGIGLALIRKK